MALKTIVLATAISDLMIKLQANDGKDPNNTPTKEYSDGLAAAIKAFVESGEVEVIAASGKIAVEGTAAKQANTAPISIKGKVS